mgnify:CR=1 FL=1
MDKARLPIYNNSAGDTAAARRLRRSGCRSAAAQSGRARCRKTLLPASASDWRKRVCFRPRPFTTPPVCKTAFRADGRGGPAPAQCVSTTAVSPADRGCCAASFRLRMRAPRAERRLVASDFFAFLRMKDRKEVEFPCGTLSCKARDRRRVVFCDCRL